MSVEFEKPIEGKAYCGCGCGKRDSHAPMGGLTHPGFGAVYLRRDGETVWPWGMNVSDEVLWGKTFQDYANAVKLYPAWESSDWRLKIDGPLSDYTYQLQNGVWILIEQGKGFA